MNRIHRHTHKERKRNKFCFFLLRTVYRW